MKIAINAMSAKIGGGITYIRNLVPRLSQFDPDNEYYIFVSKENKSKLFPDGVREKNVKLIEIRTFNLLSRLLREQVFIPFYIWQKKIDLLYCPANIVSFFAPCKKVLWIQNIDPFIELPGEPVVKRLRMKLLRWLTVRSMFRAEIVIFSSDYSRKLILGATSIDAAKTRRIFLGAEIDKFLSKRGGRGDYLLSVSNISKRKNYEVLIKAYALLKPAIRDKYQLKLVGDISEQYKLELLSLCQDEEIRARIVFTGMLSGEPLYEFYKNAAIFILPSLVESFSLPIIEAMAAGLPVIASNQTCLPEMIDEYGLLFDPYDEHDLASKITAVLENEPLRQRLSARGIDHARVFSWDETARNIIKLFKEMA